MTLKVNKSYNKLWVENEVELHLNLSLFSTQMGEVKRMKKRILVALAVGMFVCSPISVKAEAAKSTEVNEYQTPFGNITDEEQLSDMYLLAQLVQAEAGNQSLEGKRLVVDVVLNRVADPRFPNTVEEVIFQQYKGYYQFSVVKNGAWDKAAKNMSDDDYDAVSLEYEEKTNSEVIYFNCGSYVPKTTALFKEGGHYFSK